MNKRLLTFGNSTISIEYGDGVPADLVDFLFQKIPHSTTADPWTHLRLEERPSEEQTSDNAAEGRDLSLWQDGKLLIKSEPPANMAYSLMSQVCFTLAYDSRDGLLLHSAAVQMGGKGIIMPGKTGAGKSTLTAWLLSHGGRYLTDELVYFADSSDGLDGFSRPLTIKEAGRHLLPGLLADESAVVFRAEPVDMIFPESFGADLLAAEMPLNLILFPSYQPGQELDLQPISKALAAYELMKCLANARNLNDHGLPEAMRLASLAPAYSIRYSELEQAGRAIIDILR